MFGEQIAHVSAQRLDAAVLEDFLVLGLGSKELSLKRARLVHGAAIVDIRLATVHNSDVAQSQWHDFTLQILHRARPAVHNVELGDDAQRSKSIRINLLGQRQRITIR